MYILRTTRSLARIFAAWAAVLAVAFSIAIAPSGSAQAEDISPPLSNSQPHQSGADRALKNKPQIITAASERATPSTSFVETINKLLGVRPVKTIAHG